MGKKSKRRAGKKAPDNGANTPNNTNIGTVMPGNREAVVPTAAAELCQDRRSLMDSLMAIVEDNFSTDGKCHPQRMEYFLVYLEKQHNIVLEEPDVPVTEADRNFLQAIARTDPENQESAPFRCLAWRNMGLISYFRDKKVEETKICFWNCMDAFQETTEEEMKMWLDVLAVRLGRALTEMIRFSLLLHQHCLTKTAGVGVDAFHKNMKLLKNLLERHVGDKNDQDRMLYFDLYMQSIEYSFTRIGNEIHQVSMDMTREHFTVDDRELLKRIMNDSDEPAHFRAGASHVLAIYYAFQDDERSVELHMRCSKCVLEMCQAATETEKMQPLLMTPTKTVGDILRDLAEDFHRSPVSFYSRPFLKWDPVRNEDVEISRVPGDQCDCCLAKSQDTAEMLRCGRCKFTYYCSAECQRKHWKEQHKKQCRKKGEFRVGDWASVVDRSETIPNFNGQFVVIVAPDESGEEDPDAPQKWIVANVKDSTKTKTLPSTQMVNVRPALWGVKF